MKKFAIAILLSAGTLISVNTYASDRAAIGAVDSALVGSYFGGAHGAVADAIIGAAIGSSSKGYYGHRGNIRYERDYGRYERAPVYYAPPAYETYYEPRYEPRRVVYVQPCDSYPVYYSGYRAPVYIDRYASPRRVHHISRNGYYDHHRRY